MNFFFYSDNEFYAQIKNTTFSPMAIKRFSFTLQIINVHQLITHVTLRPPAKHVLQPITIAIVKKMTKKLLSR